MPRYEVSIGKEVAWDATVIVEAASPEEAEDLAWAQVTEADWHEGDWESAGHVQDVVELDDEDAAEDEG